MGSKTVLPISQEPLNAQTSAYMQNKRENLLSAYIKHVFVAFMRADI